MIKLKRQATVWRLIRVKLIGDYREVNNCVCMWCVFAGSWRAWSAVSDVVSTTRVFLPTHWSWNITTVIKWRRDVYCRCAVSAFNVRHTHTYRLYLVASRQVAQL